MKRERENVRTYNIIIGIASTSCIKDGRVLTQQLAAHVETGDPSPLAKVEKEERRRGEMIVQT